MSIQPIDLQTLFVRLSHVGREQSAMKQAILQNQEVTGREIAERSRQAGATVQESEEVSEGPETVDEEGNPSQHNPTPQHETSSGEDEPNESSEDVFRDPDLGQIVDLEG